MKNFRFNLIGLDTLHTLYGGSVVPKVEIKQSKTHASISIKTPSLTPSSYSVQIEGMVLKVYREIQYSASIKDKLKSDKETLSIQIGDVLLNNGIDVENIDAVFENGALNIYIPYSKNRSPKQEIKIKFNNK